jgi:hypothetical protein
MGVFTITLQDLDALPDVLGEHDGPIGVDFDEGFSWDELNQVRFLLSQLDLNGEAIVDQGEGTVDELIEHVVQHLAADKPGMRLRAPETLTSDGWAEVREHLEPGSSLLFYVDGEDEPFDSGRLYDQFEDAIFDEGDEDAW